jgi:flavin reductase (DIM6/NTAB) family NADH-FMN oxidoreductase RutF
MLMNLADMKASEIYFAMIQTILPRPVAWVISENKDASWNLAPFSYFNAISSSPPLISLSIGKKKDGSLKDTRRNISERDFFTVQIPSVEQAQLVTDSAKPFNENVSEIDALGLDLVYEDGFRVPRLKNSKVTYFCRKEEILEIGSVPQGLIIGRVEAVYIDDSIIEYKENRLKVNAAQLNPLARLGGNDYAGITEPFSVYPSKD